MEPIQTTPITEPLINNAPSKSIINKNLVIGVLFGVILLLSGIIIGYVLSSNKSETIKTIPQGNSTLLTPTLTPPAKAINFKDETFSISEDTAILGKFTLNVGLKIPENWELKKTINSNNSCTNITLRSKDNKYLMMSLEFYCKGWAAKYQTAPLNSKVVANENRTNLNGKITRSLVRYPNKAGAYIYSSADAERETFDLTRDKFMDAFLVSFLPEETLKNDMYFEAALLDAQNMNGSELLLADQVASSIHIISLVKNTSK